MPTPASIFDQHMDVWTAEQNMPWARLKYAIVQANLRRHLLSSPLSILDAGGGNGHDSLPFAAEGHHVTIVDYSREMLADAERVASFQGIQDRVMTHQAELSEIPDILTQQSFDAVFCHNVLQYVDDISAMLSAIAAPLKPGGILSLISVNRYSTPYIKAFLRNDLKQAYASIDAHSENAVLFGTPMAQYTADEIAGMLQTVDCELVQDYGIHCVCAYWGDNQRKSDPAVMADLERLELALTDQHPYKLLARYFQVIALKHST